MLVFKRKVNLNLSTDLSLQRFSIAFPNIALIFAMANPYQIQFAFLFPIIAYLFPISVSNYMLCPPFLYPKLNIQFSF